ncbi:MAG: DUF1203 domain-containing protein [Pseudomonadota bacterium]
MAIKFEALPTEAVRALQNGAADSYGSVPEKRVSDGNGVPCRHCLRNIEAGQAYLTLAYRPFQSLQPYAETGPIFLHAEPCERAGAESEIPEMLSSPEYIVRGYDANERIVYGTGGVVATAEIAARSAKLLADEGIAFVHVRSAQNNCFQCRVERM